MELMSIKTCPTFGRLYEHDAYCSWSMQMCITVTQQVVFQALPICSRATGVKQSLGTSIHISLNSRRHDAAVSIVGFTTLETRSW
jgi:hypothetical protein